MDYCKMGIWKVNEFDFLNKEVEEITRMWSQNLVNLRNPGYLKEKAFEYCLWGISRLYI